MSAPQFLYIASKREMKIQLSYLDYGESRKGDSPATESAQVAVGLFTYGLCFSVLYI